MRTLILPPALSACLTSLYQEMEEAYDQVAQQLDFSCRGCPDNCCDSYFLHHTYIEWAYLWEGLQHLSPGDKDRIEKQAKTCFQTSHLLLAAGERPVIMCPLNVAGRCFLYSHRLMICRMHGVPSRFTRPDGVAVTSPGCFRCQELIPSGENPEAFVDRTNFYIRLRDLEQEFRRSRTPPLPPVKMTIAAMIVQGPPEISL